MPKTPQDLGRDYETAFAKRIGGQVVPGSGNKWYVKGDVTSNGFVWSLKHTTAESFRLTKGMLHEVVRAVIGPGGFGGDVTPVMAVSIQGDDEYAVLRMDDFLALMRDNVKVIPPTRSQERRERAAIPKFNRSSHEEEV